MASVITGTDDMKAQSTLWMHESQSAVIDKILNQTILTAE